MLTTWLEDLTQSDEQPPQLAPKLMLAGVGLVAVGGLMYLLASKARQEFVDLVPVNDDECTGGG